MGLRIFNALSVLPAGIVTGSGAAGQVTLWSGASTLTGDTGFTWSGTGTSFIASTTGKYNVATGGAYTFNSVNAMRATDTPSDNWFFAQAGAASLAGVSGSNNIMMGTSAGEDLTTGYSNVGIGSNALRNVTDGTLNVGVGVNVGAAVIGGDYNTGVGSGAIGAVSTGNNNTAVGAGALGNGLTTGSGCVALGYAAGYYETGSNKLFIDNATRASEADGRAKALIYGVFDAAVANQSLTFNTGTFSVPAGLVRIGTATTADALADTLIATSATTQKALVLQDKAAQTANTFETQISTGSTSFYVAGNAEGVRVTKRNAAVATNAFEVYRDATLNFAVNGSAGGGASLNGSLSFLGASDVINMGAGRVYLRATANNVFSLGTSGSNTDSWFNYAGQSRVSANVTNATATMANVTGLSATLAAGRKYSGRIVLFCANSVAADGIKVDFDGGAATMTTFRAHTKITGTALLTSTQTSALATDVTAATVTGDAVVEVDFGSVCNAAGTFIPRFACNAATTGTATIYATSFMTLNDIA